MRKPRPDGTRATEVGRNPASSMVVGSTFLEEVEHMCLSRGVDVLDAAVTWCERNGVEYESVAPLIKKAQHLKTRLQAEAEAVRTVKRVGGRLPI